MKHLFLAVTLIVFTMGSVKASAAEEERPVKVKHKRKVPYENLNTDEKEILARGEISQASYIVGGILGIWPGLGIGHAVQSRYSDKGWIFTVGELGSIAIMAIGISNSINGTTCTVGSASSTCTLSSAGYTELVIGYLGFLGFKIWEIVDVWVGPPELNRKYHDLKGRVDDEETRTRFMILPVAMADKSFGLGAVLRF